MTLLFAETAALRARIQQNEKILREMKWARTFAGDDAYVPVDPVELRLQAEIQQLERAIALIEATSRRSATPHHRVGSAQVF